MLLKKINQQLPLAPSTRRLTPTSVTCRSCSGIKGSLCLSRGRRSQDFRLISGCADGGLPAFPAGVLSGQADRRSGAHRHSPANVALSDSDNAAVLNGALECRRQFDHVENCRRRGRDSMAHCRGCLWIRRRSASIERPVQPKFQRIIDALIPRRRRAPWSQRRQPSPRLWRVHTAHDFTRR